MHAPHSCYPVQPYPLTPGVAVLASVPTGLGEYFTVVPPFTVDSPSTKWYFELDTIYGDPGERGDRASHHVLRVPDYHPVSPAASPPLPRPLRPPGAHGRAAPRADVPRLRALRLRDGARGPCHHDGQRRRAKQVPQHWPVVQHSRAGERGRLCALHSLSVEPLPFLPLRRCTASRAAPSASRRRRTRPRSCCRRVAA